MLVLPLAVAAPLAPDTVARPIGLADALALARDHALAAVQSRGDVRTNAAAERSAWGAFIPNASVSLGTSHQYPTGGTRTENGQVIIVQGDPWSYSAGLSANVALFEGGRRLFDVQQARANTAAAKAGELEQRYQVDLAVKQAYYAIQAARENQLAARAQLEQTEQQLRITALRVRAGNAMPSDSLRAQIPVLNAQVAVLEARDALRVADVVFTHALGSFELLTAAPADTAAPPPLEVGETQLAAWADTGPQVQRARKQLDAARAGHDASWTSYLPTVTAGYSRNGNGSGQTFDFNDGDLQYSGSLRFSLNFPLFDQFGREEQLVRTDVALDNADAALKDAYQEAREALARDLSALRSAEARVTAQTGAILAGGEDLRVQQRRYATGEGLLLDVLVSQATLIQARQALIQARYDQRVALAQIEALIGRDL